MTSLATRLVVTSAAATVATLLALRRRSRPAPPPRGVGMDQAGGKDRLLRKCETVLSKRTDQIMVVVERSVDTHNYSAIIRTAEALGIHPLGCVTGGSAQRQAECAHEKRTSGWRTKGLKARRVRKKATSG